MSEKQQTQQIPPPARGRLGGGLKRFRIVEEDVRSHTKELRKNATEAEKLLWSRLKLRQTGHSFRRQHPLGRYIVDFICLEKKLVIELDGGQHNVRASYDQARTDDINARGVRVLRFWNYEVLENLDVVCQVIEHALNAADPHLTSPLQGEGS